MSATKDRVILIDIALRILFDTTTCQEFIASLRSWVLPCSMPIALTVCCRARQFVQAGFSSVLGLGLASMLGGRANAQPSKPRKAKSLIIVFLTGAASHHDTFDMKPDAPEEIRGQFKADCHVRPWLAGLRTLAALGQADASRNPGAVAGPPGRQSFAGHASGTYRDEDSRGQIRSDCLAERLAVLCRTLDYFQPRSDGVPNGVTLPTFLMEGPLIWPGQHAGFLGAKHDPWHIKQDPNKPDFRVDSMKAADGPQRMHDRRVLLEEMNRLGKEGAKISDQQEQAFNILTSGKLAQAFELEREPVAVRDRYGRHMFGQSLLLARRLVEAGVPVVQANMGKVQNWDNHGNIFGALKDRLLPPLDIAMSALLDDLHVRLAARHDGCDVRRIWPHAQSK